MEALDKIKAYLDCYGIKCRKEDEEFSCLYGRYRLVVDDKYIIWCNGHWGQDNWVVKEIDGDANLVEQDAEFSAFDRREHRPRKRKGYSGEVIEFLDKAFNIEKSRYYYDFDGHRCEDLGKKKAERELEYLAKQLDEKDGPLSVLDKNGYDYYYDEEYESPNKEDFLKMYEDSKIGWDSSEGFRIGMHESSWNEGFEYVIEYPNPKPIESKYSSWKDIAKKFRDMDIEELEGRIESVKEYYDDLIEDD